MFLEPRSVMVHKIRFQLENWFSPIVEMAILPERWGQRFSLWFLSQRSWQEKAQSWEQQRLSLQFRQLRLAALSQENAKLKEWLKVVEHQKLEALGTRVVQVLPTENRLRLQLGKEQGLTKGDAVLGPKGAIGVVESVSAQYASVILASSPRYSLPVTVLRSGVNMNVTGTGYSQVLTIPHIPETTDIQPGDLLVTSGLAERFPPGYPVATVTEVLRNPADPFSRIKAVLEQPLDQIDFVMVIPHGATNAS